MNILTASASLRKPSCLKRVCVHCDTWHKRHVVQLWHTTQMVQHVSVSLKYEKQRADASHYSKSLKTPPASLRRNTRRLSISISIHYFPEVSPEKPDATFVTTQGDKRSHRRLRILLEGQADCDLQECGPCSLGTRIWNIVQHVHSKHVRPKVNPNENLYASEISDESASG